MRLSYVFPVLVMFALAAAASALAAVLAVDRIERHSHRQISAQLVADGQTWAEVAVDGLQVTLSGTAPDEATRFRAISLAGHVVDPTRVIDAMKVDPGEAVEPPRFSIEILRNDAGITLIGLVPGALDRDAVAATIGDMSDGVTITDLLESADYPVPFGWAPALSFGLDALAMLPRSKISVAADRVAITAISDSADERASLMRRLHAAVPAGLTLDLDISAPRPVITPFSLRFLIDDDGVRFDACSAHTPEGRARILAAAREAGLHDKADCRLGLGVPSPRWPDAATLSIGALDELGGGSVTISDADITLVARDDTAPAMFDRVVGDLEAALPEVFSLHAVLPEPVVVDGTGAGEGPPEFVATLSPEGLLQLRGRITDERLRVAVEGFARARFGGAEVHGAMRLASGLPGGWPVRVLAGLDALSYLAHGSVIVQEEYVEIRGASGSEEASEDIARILSTQLGEAENFSIDVSYIEALDPEADLPTPLECVRQINRILNANKIVFAPGSADIDADAAGTIAAIAEAMDRCDHVPMEIGGHTDSQGREVMNQRLSQARAEAVLTALVSRRVQTANLSALGYGETQPVADNGTETGREVNRRIEFKLLEPDLPEGETANDAVPDAEETQVAEDAGAGDEPAASTEPEGGAETGDEAATGVVVEDETGGETAVDEDEADTPVDGASNETGAGAESPAEITEDTDEQN